MNALPKQRMTVDEFIAWASVQRGRFELVRGQLVAMAPERARHNLAKLAIARVLQDGVRRAGLPCTVFTDGMTVRIDDTTAREPDAAVQCGASLDLDSMELAAPMIVVEVISPSSERNDVIGKLAEYFSLPSVVHYLIVDAEKATVVHHRRDGEGGTIRTTIHTAGTIELSPPGFAFAVADVFAGV